LQEYDIALNLLLQGSARLTMRELTGTPIVKWLDVELPKVQNRRMDLLGETADGSLFHMELQSTNEAAIPLRMAEYSLGERFGCTDDSRGRSCSTSGKRPCNGD